MLGYVLLQFVTQLANLEPKGSLRVVAWWTVLSK